MTKEEILNYVMDTPENTNRAVLSDMLDEFNTSSSNGANALIINIEKDGDTYTTDKTAREIIDAMPLVYVLETGIVDKYAVSFYTELDEYGTALDDSGYMFYVSGNMFTAATLDDYPSYTEGTLGPDPLL